MTTATTELAGLLESRKSEIIQEWIHRLHTEVGPQYSARPLEELQGTITEAFDANLQVIRYDDYGPINGFIDRITQMRLKSGFQLSDVQKAFELFRRIVVPIMVVELGSPRLAPGLERLNRCLAHTMHRFSENFQHMHQLKILEHNRHLEEKVRLRTAALEESERKYKTLVEEINDGYFVIQEESVVFANQAFCRMHGCFLDEVVGHRFDAFVAPADRAQLLDNYLKSIQGIPTPKVFEYMRLTKDGNTFPTEIQAKMTLYDQKLSSIGICRDITKRVKMEHKVRESERMAYIGQITASLSHEIRNPLSAVKLNLQILNKNEKITGNDSRRIDISVAEVKRLERILNQLLEFAKPVLLNRQAADPREIIKSATDLLEIKIKEQDLRLVCDLPPDLPAVTMDGEKMVQALINLLLNAMEASRPGGEIQVKASHAVHEEKPSLCIEVIDQGHGLSEASRRELFKPFYTTKTKGTGLGLSNVKRIVAAHGGEITARNNPRAGAWFALTIPAGA